jgi:hypothetical protein
MSRRNRIVCVCIGCGAKTEVTPSQIAGIKGRGKYCSRACKHRHSKPRARPLSDRFFDKIVPEPTSGCWLWEGALTSVGYGHISVRTGEQVLAHRVSLALHGVEVPSDMEVDHLCMNRPCVNPDHLEVVTSTENLRRQREGIRRRGA